MDNRDYLAMNKHLKAFNCKTQHFAKCESISYKQQAETHYKNEPKRSKAIAAGTAMDNALRLEYTKGGHSKCHFMMDNYLKYFTYEALTKQKTTL